jgi:hypothetical protein
MNSVIRRVSLLLAASLFLAACTSDQVTQTLEAAVDAAIAADSIARPQDQPYLTLAQGCLDAAASVLETNGAPGMMATQIGAQCATAVAAEQGAPITVQAVSAALNTFLRAVTVTTSQIRFSNGLAINAWLASPSGKISKARLKKIRKKLDKLKAKHR